mmetsp:Transcript_15505/g.24793  ORF Transcript_15505/g.24793 Transcript_15505/m.24793 type:complete len:197 (-) Transcript_15505:141-731(-)
MAACKWRYVRGASKKKKASIYWQDDEFMAVYDAFPKAKIHLLLLPCQRIVDSPSCLTGAKEDLDLVDRMYSRATWLTERLLEANGGRLEGVGKIKLGFHAVPSLRQLHLHIISDDFDSPCLKNKKHWNSFTTDFFVAPEDMLIALRENGGFHPNRHEMSRLLVRPLRCHRCHAELSFMPRLKIHITKCKKKKNITE